MPHDIRYALRLMRKSPSATVIAVLTMAIGVGANTAIFSLIRAVLLKPLPYADASRLVLLGERWPTLPGPRIISRLNYRDWTEQNTVFERMAAVTWGNVTVSGGNPPVHVEGALVTPGYFDVFGLRAASGRTFAPNEDQPGRDHVVVLSHRLWSSRFGRDPAILGTSIRLDGELYMIIGVMPAGTSVEFGFNLSDPQLWRPLSAEAPPPRGAHDLRSAAAKMKAGVTLEQARAQMDAIGDRLARQYPDTNKGYGVVVQPFPRPVGLHVESSLYLLFGAAAVVLLLACVNLANLAIARGAAMAREAAIRTALGAGRAHINRQILTEHLLVAAAGGLCGVMAGYGMLAMLKTGMPTRGVRVAFPADTSISVDAWVWLFAFGLTALSGVVSGLLPTIGMASRPLVADLREGSAGGGTGRASRRLQRALVVAEVALAFTLLTGAGLLIQSLFVLTHRIDAGFDSTNLLTARLPIPETRFASGIAYNAYLDQLASRLQSLPTIRGVAFADALPTEGNPFGKLFQIVGQPTVPYVSRPLCGFKVVSPSYFSAVGLRLIEGRGLEDRDRDDAPLVVVINQAMARTYFRGVDPLAQRMLMRRNPVRGLPGTVDLEWTVVGLVADEGVSPENDRTTQPAVYVTREQYPRLDLALVVRTMRDPAHMEDTIRAAIAAVDSTQAVGDVKTVAQLEADDMASDRLRSILLSAFAAVAVVLATVGLYGVMAYSVVQRTREIGIRAALGASTASLRGLVMRQGTAMIGWGLGAGLVISVVTTRLLKTFLFGVGPSDPATMIVVAGALSCVALAACYVPAHRATAVDPLIVLKSE
ncbi:MAG TPA: ABC transporter permease [Vicinamibacterales bacterium]|nr:ABC transporter permease [Vicinamibacterales bacterium]